MSAFLEGGRRFVAGLAGWKLPLLLVASLLLNLGFVLVWVLQPLPPAVAAKGGAGVSVEESAVVTGGALETRLRAAGYAEAEARKIVAAAGIIHVPAKRAVMAEAMPGDDLSASGETQRAREAGATSGSRVISIGSTGANPAVNHSAAGVQNRSSSPTLRSAESGGSAPASGGSDAPAVGGSNAPAVIPSPAREITPLSASPDAMPAAAEFPRRRVFSRDEQLYRSLYGWQSYNAALTESAQDGNSP